jgi:hypothetical protein
VGDRQEEEHSARETHALPRGTGALRAADSRSHISQARMSISRAPLALPRSISHLVECVHGTLTQRSAWHCAVCSSKLSIGNEPEAQEQREDSTSTYNEPLPLLGSS